MTVYVVISGEYDDEEIEGVYSSHEKAIQAAENCPKARGPFVLDPPFELDAPTIHQKRRKQ